MKISKEVKCNLSFYNSQQGLKIMDPSNFNTAIYDFLAHEKNIIINILKINGYRTLIEIGCGNAQNAKEYLQVCQHYCGIDINLNQKEEIREIVYEKQKKISLYKQSIEQYAVQNLGNLGISNSLCLFPFNIFGNIDDNLYIFKELLSSGNDILVSSFKTNFQADQARLEYYHKCDFEGLSHLKDEGVSTFLAKNGFKSSSFSPFFLLSHLLTFLRTENISLFIINNNCSIGWHLYAIQLKNIKQG